MVERVLPILSTSENVGVLVLCEQAQVCMRILVGFGLALTFASIPSASYVSTWSEFRSSGWTDATAFGSERETMETPARRSRTCAYLRSTNCPSRTITFPSTLTLAFARGTYQTGPSALLPPKFLLLPK